MVADIGGDPDVRRCDFSRDGVPIKAETRPDLVSCILGRFAGETRRRTLRKSDAGYKEREEGWISNSLQKMKPFARNLEAG